MLDSCSARRFRSIFHNENVPSPYDAAARINSQDHGLRHFAQPAPEHTGLEDGCPKAAEAVGPAQFITVA